MFIEFTTNDNGRDSYISVNIDNICCYYPVIEKNYYVSDNEDRNTCIVMGDKSIIVKESYLDVDFMIHDALKRSKE